MKDLNAVLNSIDIKADWIGLREVCENKTYRFIRDLNPQSNTRISSHGVMVEVLSNGQFFRGKLNKTINKDSIF